MTSPITPANDNIDLGGCCAGANITDCGWIGFDVFGKVIGSDPMFVDAANLDFRLLEQRLVAAILALYRN